MCGRYGLVDTSKLRDLYDIDNPQDLSSLEPRYNIAPSQWLPVITRNGKNHVQIMRWN
ncbi:MAG: SOS response-associated peptidase family protein [Candidatus Daviesbacteria bacterium]|nr:MAG: SOS response-associated peptidase family protein [Candidatus Daviesbacteria bacterium]